jgi:hypothetical protein
VHGELVGEVGPAARIGRLDRLAHGFDALGPHQRAGGALVAAAQHPLAQYAGNRSHDVAHGFQLRSRDPVIVAQAMPSWRKIAPTVSMSPAFHASIIL